MTSTAPGYQEPTVTPEQLAAAQAIIATAIAHGTPIKQLVTRAWSKLAPQLIAFLATGLTSTGVLAVLAVVHIHVPLTIAALAVGFVSSVAAYIQRDKLLGLSAKVLSGKLAAFILTGTTATVVIGISSAFGCHPPTYIVGLIVTGASLLAGYFKSDTTVTQVITS